MKKALPLTLVLIGAALLITAVVFWIDSSTSTQPDSFGKSLRDWITLILGIGASLKGWMDLFKKEKPTPPIQNIIESGVVSRNVQATDSEIVFRDKITTTNIVSEDSPYNVEGLPNPYLGLQAFTYVDRDRYAGREKLTAEALQLLISSEEQRNLLFVTGASGSGKSSFVQASLLPALVNYFQERGETVKFEVIRPSRNPKTRFDETLRQLDLRTVRVIVIDQFEEIFTQSIPNERDELFAFLEKLEPFIEDRLCIIATLRSDYLGEMFDIKWLWEIAKHGIELRDMKIQELKNAIIRPLQSKYPDGEKRIETKLVEQLAEDTAESITYLPLLQVTLEELWNKGQLKLSAYNSLTDAIKERADTVLSYHDFDKASPNVKRSKIEQEELLSVLLDLVNPSPDADFRHDVRVARKLVEFDEKKTNLIRELSRARLVSIEIEDSLEVVNLIHETLIRSWDVLSKSIQEKRLQLQKRVRFEEQLRLWVAQNKNDDYLLSKGQLTEALELNNYNDIAIGTKIAQEFLRKSNQKTQASENVKASTQSFIDAISKEIAKGRDLYTVCEVVIQAGAKLISSEGCSLYLIHTNNHIELTHSTYLADTNYIGRRKPISNLPESGLTAWVAYTGEILCFNNEEYKQHIAWAGETEHLIFLPSKRCESILIAPVKDNSNKIIGVISLENKRTLAGLVSFNDEDIARLVSLANELARAFEIIGFYEDIRELERSGLTDDLHDIINWYHSGVVLWIEAVNEWFKRGDTEKVNKLMPDLIKHAHTTINELKTFHFNFLNRTFEANTLKQALLDAMQFWVNRAMPKYKGELQVKLNCPEDLDVPLKIRKQMVRIASLAFSNAIQHSGILDNPQIGISVTVEQKNSMLEMSITDNGCGMDLLQAPVGYGLDRIRQLTKTIEKFGYIKASIVINSKLGEGTSVILRLG